MLETMAACSARNLTVASGFVNMSAILYSVGTYEI